MNALERNIVLMSQRARLLEAIVEVVAEKGYAATTVADIIRRARVSRTTFYEQFPDKESCFLAGYEASAHAHIEHVRTALLRTHDWMEQVYAGTLAYVEAMVAAPAFAKTFLLEVHAAGPRARALRAEAYERYSDLIRDWYSEARRDHPDLPTPPDDVFRAAVGAIDQVVAKQLETTGVTGLHDAIPTLVYIQLALLGLPEAAHRALDTAPRSP